MKYFLFSKSKKKPRSSFRKITHTIRVFIRVVLGLLLVGALSWAIFYSGLFSVRSVNITGETRFVNINDVRVIFDSLCLNKNIFFVNSKKIQKNIKNSFPSIKTVRLARHLPSTIIFEVYERIPRAVLNAGTTEKYLVDPEGYVLGISSDEFSYLPEFTYEGDVFIGKFVDGELVPFLFKMLDETDKFGIKTKTIFFDKDFVKVALSSGEEVYVPFSEQVLSENVLTVRAVLRQAVAEGKKVAKIDLRYDKVIVSYR